MTSQVRQPVFWLEAAGTRLPVLEGEVSISWEQEADCFEAVLAVYGLPPGFGPDYWSRLGTPDCAVIGRNDTGISATLFTGQIDQAEVDFTKGTVRASGRGNAAKLLDRKITKKYADQSSSEIIQDVASQAGLSAETDSLSNKAGKIHTEEYAHLTDLQTAWDVVVFLANREGKVPFVKGSTVYFKDAGQGVDGTGAIAVSFTPPGAAGPARGNVTKLACLKHGTLAGEVRATVNSWHTRKEKAVSVTKGYGGSGGEGSGSGTGGARVYEFRYPNLTDDQADALADKTIEEIVANEIQVEVEMPGDVTTVGLADLSVSGTGTGFDQTYAIRSATHRLDCENGYTMTIVARGKAQGRQKSAS